MKSVPTRSACIRPVAAALGCWVVVLALGASHAAAALSLRTPAFSANGDIPTAFTCEGNGISPMLMWSNAPPGTKSFALIVDDPDAPDPQAPRMTFVHWVLYNLPPTANALAEGIKPGDLPSGTHEGLNDSRRTGYSPPCPPRGRHRYFFKLYALDVVLPDLGTPTKAKLEQAMQGHHLGKAELIGTFEKRR